AHFDFALSVAIVVVPGIVHKGEATIDSGADDADGESFFSLADVRSAQANHGNILSGLAELAVEHVALAGFRRHRKGIGLSIGGGGAGGSSCNRRLDEGTAFHGQRHSTPSTGWALSTRARRSRDV